MSPFPFELTATQLGGSCKWWRLWAPFSFVLEPGRTVTAPAGFVTDGATVPRLFWALYPPTGLLFRAAVVHDFAYSQLAAGAPDPAVPTRAAADAMLRRAAIAGGADRAGAWLIWAAVRLFGGRHATPARLAGKPA